MSAFFALLAVVLPVFAIVGAGYGLVRLKRFPDAGVDGVLRFATNFAVPILLFRAMYGLEFSAAFRLDHQVSFYAASACCFVLGGLLARCVWKRRPDAAVAAGFAAMFPNSVLLGLPVMERAYGRLDEIHALIVFHTPFCYFVGIAAMEICRRDSASPSGSFGLLETAAKIGKAMFHNPLVIGLTAGFAANVSGLAMPEPAAAAVDMLADAALPASLFGLGGALARYAVSKRMGETLTVTGISLFAHPALAWLLAVQVFALPAPFAQSAVVMAALPAGVNAYIFATLYGTGRETAASTVVIATALSLATIPLWLAVLGG